MAEKKTHQVSVSLSGKVLEYFNELKEELYITTDAELLRMALKAYYKMRLMKNDQEAAKNDKVINLKNRIEYIETKLDKLGKIIKEQ